MQHHTSWLVAVSVILGICILSLTNVPLAVGTDRAALPGQEPGLELLLTMHLHDVVELLDIHISSDADPEDPYHHIGVAYIDSSPHGDFALASRTISSVFAVAQEQNLRLDWVTVIPVTQSLHSTRAVIEAAPGLDPNGPRLFRVLQDESRSLSLAELIVVRNWLRSWRFDIKDPSWQKPDIP